MQTVVLAAGRGTRMRPLTDRRPKPLLPVGDRPLLGHVLERAGDSGATSFVIVVREGDESIRSTIGDRYHGIPVRYVEQSSPDGTASALAVAVDNLDPEYFAVINGDVLLERSALESLFVDRPGLVTTTVDDPTSFGVLTIDDGRVTGIVEKPAEPPSNRVNAGAYVFPPAARGWIDVPKSERGEYELTSVVQRACRETDVRAVPAAEWLDVGRPWDLLAATERVLGDLDHAIDGTVHDQASLSGPVRIAPDATVRAGTVIDGPVVLAAGASVGPNAYIRGATVIGPNAQVGNGVEIKNSIIMADANVNHLSYVGDSILGRSVNLGAGTMVANLRHDGNPIEMTVKGTPQSTGRRKFGVVVGDSAKTGINTSLNAGVTLGTGARTMPGETVLHDP